MVRLGVALQADDEVELPLGAHGRDAADRAVELGEERIMRREAGMDDVDLGRDGLEHHVEPQIVHLGVERQIELGEKRRRRRLRRGCGA